MVEKPDVLNLDFLADQILADHIIVGRGLFCQAVIKSQSKHPDSSDVCTALVALINFRRPQVGHLLVKRVALQFKVAHARGDKQLMHTSSALLAQLVNQRVAYEILALDVLMILLEDPSPDNVEVAARFCRQCGALLLEVAPGELREILGEFRGLLRKGELEPRPRPLIGRMFAAYRVAFRESARGLKVVDDEEQVPNYVTLVENIDPETSLDRFHTNSHLLEEDEVTSNPS
ncbi:pre-mRNA-splicing factor cwc22, variant 2 [Salvia divinorum]